MEFTPHSLKRLHELRREIVLELAPSHPDKKAWIGIYPVFHGDRHKGYEVLRFEIFANSIIPGKKLTEHEVYLLDKAMLSNLQTLYDLLKVWGVMPEHFREPESYGYPLA